MAFRRGDIVLIPFPYTDLSASKTRPAVVVSSDIYHATRAELLLAYVSSQISQANPTIDYVLADWADAGLLKPSYVRPKVAAVEPTLVVHRVGALSARDLLEVDRCLRRAMALVETALGDVLAEVDLTVQLAATVQALAEKSVAATVFFASAGKPGVDLDRLRELLSGQPNDHLSGGACAASSAL
jgi:mRNA interferase MazF